MKVVLAYLIAGSYTALLWQWRRGRPVKVRQRPLPLRARGRGHGRPPTGRPCLRRTQRNRPDSVSGWAGCVGPERVPIRRLPGCEGIPCLSGILGDVGAALTDPGRSGCYLSAAPCISCFRVAPCALGRRSREGRDGGWRIEDRASTVRPLGSGTAMAGGACLWADRVDGFGGGGVCAPLSRQAVKSTQALTLLGAAMMGQGAGLWERDSLKSEVQSLKSGRRTVVGCGHSAAGGGGVAGGDGDVSSTGARRGGPGRGTIRIRLGC